MNDCLAVHGERWCIRPENHMGGHRFVTAEQVRWLTSDDDEANYALCSLRGESGAPDPEMPQWIVDQRGDVWSRWVSDDLYHQGSRTASLADVVQHYGPVQALTPGRIIRDGGDLP